MHISEIYAQFETVVSTSAYSVKTLQQAFYIFWLDTDTFHLPVFYHITPHENECQLYV